MHYVSAVNSPNSARLVCLDLVDVKWDTSPAEIVAESAIIVEVWGGHANLHTSAFIPQGASVTINGHQGTLSGHVAACKRDGDFGYVVEVEYAGRFNEESDGGYPVWYLPVTDSFESSTLLPC